MSDWEVQIDCGDGWARLVAFISRQLAEETARLWGGKNPGRMFRVVELTREGE